MVRKLTCAHAVGGRQGTRIAPRSGGRGRPRPRGPGRGRGTGGSEDGPAPRTPPAPAGWAPAPDTEIQHFYSFNKNLIFWTGPAVEQSRSFAGPVFLNVYGAQKSNPRKRFRQSVARRAGTSNRVIVPTRQAVNEWIPGLLKRFTNTGSVLCLFLGYALRYQTLLYFQFLSPVANVSDPIRIRMDPIWFSPVGSGSGSRRAKWPTKIQKVKKFQVLKWLMLSFEGWRLLL